MSKNVLPFTMTNTNDPISDGLAAVQTQITAMKALETALQNGMSEPFRQAFELLRDVQGRIIISGIGKSGHVSAKIAATLSSTGSPAHFLHPAEASHGDLGMICSNDVVVLLSNSGETEELSGILRFSKRFSVPVIGVTAEPNSTLARNSSISLVTPKVAESCPNNLAPTSSTMVQLALGDALAISLLKARGFTPDDFKTFHPGGKLGAKLTPVQDIMHVGNSLPLMTTGSLMRDALLTMTEKGFGCLGVTNQVGQLQGIITDGDLRRHMDNTLMEQRIEDVMTPNPKTLRPSTLAVEALERMNSAAVTAMFIVENDRTVGIVHLHDLLRAGTA